LFQNDLKYTGKDFKAAFDFLTTKGVRGGLPKPLEADFKALNDAEQNLLESGAIVKSPPLIGGKYSRDEILKQTIYECRSGICTPRAK